jgi:hypothetical protein
MEKGKAETVSLSQTEAVINRAKEADERRKKADMETSITNSAPENEKAVHEIAGKFESNDELSEMLNDMDLDDTVDDVVDDLSEDEDDEDEDEDEDEGSVSVAEIIRYSEVTSMERDMTEVMEREERPRSRWLMTTCRYCGDMYRFRSDQPQPPTCGKPQCIAKFEERSKKEVA